MLLGYRRLFVDYKNGGFLYDVHMSGLQAGFAIRLKYGKALARGIR